MRKPDPKHRGHLDWRERRHIKTLRRRGCSQTAIARIMHITRNSVALALRKMGLPTRQQVDEAKILALLRKNLDRKLVARTVHCSLRAVKRIGKAHQVRRKIVSDPFHGKRKQVEALLRGGVLCGREIADTLRVPYRPVLKLAHQPEFYGPGKFIGGSPTKMKPPFESYEPQVREFLENYVATQDEQEEALLAIARMVAGVGFGGKIPEGLTELTTLIAACIGVCVLMFKRNRPEVYLAPSDQAKLTDYFMPRFLRTVTTLRCGQSGLVN
jgi:hypothetical protein